MTDSTRTERPVVSEADMVVDDFKKKVRTGYIDKQLGGKRLIIAFLDSIPNTGYKVVPSPEPTDRDVNIVKTVQVETCALDGISETHTIRLLEDGGSTYSRGYFSTNSRTGPVTMDAETMLVGEDLRVTNVGGLEFSFNKIPPHKVA